MNKNRWAVVILVLSAINIYLFWPGSLYFLNDDFLHIPLSDNNELFQTNSVRPIHELLVAFDLWLWGKNAFGFHFTALILHLIVTYQVYDLSKVMQLQWLNTDKRVVQQTSFLAVALFLVYPQHSESLGWILGRTPVLASTFLLVVIRLYFSNRISYKTFVAGSILFLLSLFTYEQSILTPLLLFILSFVSYTSKEKRGRITYSLWLGASAVIYLVCRKAITKELVGEYEGGNLLSGELGILVINAFRFVSRLWINPTSSMTIFIISLCVVALLMVLVGVYWLRKVKTSKRSFVFIVGIILLLLVPMLSLGISLRSYESGRYLYMPSIFLVIGLGMVFIKGIRLTRKLFLLLLAIISIYWMTGKVIAGIQYKNASSYSKQTTNMVLSHFVKTSAPLHIDTLKLSIHQLPVYRLGFKEGIHWMNSSIDTNNIRVINLVDDAKAKQ